jgi:ribose transport system ATP-binding protein
MMSSDGAVTMSVRGLTKHFQGTTALRDVDIDFLPGTVHVLFGENGAGKSTLIKLIAGVYRPDAGSIRKDGLDLVDLTPRKAREHGIAAVFQEPALVPQMSVAENLALGREPTTRGVVQRAEMDGSARDALARLGSSINPGATVDGLTRAEQQIVEIARSLKVSAQVLILDEPTAALTDEETDRLFSIVAQLRAAGLSIIYITHRMREIRRIGDQVSVLRDGQLMRTCQLSEIDDDSLITLMTGRTVGSLFPRIRHTDGPIALRLEGVSGAGVHDVSIEVRAGEVVGLAGLVGSGKSAIGRLCFGLASLEGGRIIVGDRLVKSNVSPAGRIRRGVMYYPGDRKRNGLIHMRPVRENVSLPALRRWTRWGFVRRGSESRDTKAVLERIALRPLRPEALPSTFSGGNQQKVVLARGFVQDFAIHVFDEPTAGVDVGARAEIYGVIKRLAEEGAAVLLISSDLPEVIGLSHRLYVVTEGRVVAELGGTALREDTVLPHFFPAHEAVEEATTAPSCTG